MRLVFCAWMHCGSEVCTGVLPYKPLLLRFDPQVKPLSNGFVQRCTKNIICGSSFLEKDCDKRYTIKLIIMHFPIIYFYLYYFYYKVSPCIYPQYRFIYSALVLF